jgi:hypothetical protein
MKSPDQIQEALDTLNEIRKNPAKMRLVAALPDAFESQMPGVIVALRWVLAEDGKSLTQVSREFGSKGAESRRSRPAGP